MLPGAGLWRPYLMLLSTFDWALSLSLDPEPLEPLGWGVLLATKLTQPLSVEAKPL